MKMKNIIILILVVALGWSLYQLKNGKSIGETGTISQNYDAVIKGQVETAVSMLDAINKKVEAREMTLVKGKKLAADLLRDLRYGTDKQGYFWADTTEGINVVLYGKKEIEGKNRLNDEVKGVKYVQEIIKKAQQGGGFTDYFYPKKNEQEPKSKRAYSLEFKPFNWVVGTGYYLEDIK